MASSATGIACSSPTTLQALKQKHFQAVGDTRLVSPPSPVSFFVCYREVLAAIKLFPPGSSAGPDGFRPQHLKDMLDADSPDPQFSPLLSALASFSNLVLEGRTPLSVRPFFFGARLLALDKEEGSETHCHWVYSSVFGSKIASFRVVEEVSAFLSPCQLGVGVKGGIEAACISVTYII